MEKDIIVEVGKRTLREVKTQIFEVPIVAFPFAVWGFLFTPWWVFVLMLIAIFGWIGKREFDDYEQELLMQDLQAASVPDPIAEEVKKQEEADKQ